MPRLARIVIPGCHHHIVQRGNNRQDVFSGDDDRRRYLSILGEQSRRYALDIFGYCLMTNHVHLIVIPSTEKSLPQAIGRTHWIYAQYHNRRQGRSGHLWQNRFFSCVLEQNHLLAALIYVERNPVRAKMSHWAWQYPWSSAKAHVGAVDRHGLLNLKEWKEWSAEFDWRSCLIRPEEDEFLSGLRLNTRRGHPLASAAFFNKMEQTLGRRLLRPKAKSGKNNPMITNS